MADKVTQQDPNNQEVKKGFVFNETGNIMMATTDMTNTTIEKEVRDVFAEVSVFFGAMTKALDKEGKSLYDYDALQKIIDSSGCFVHVNEEDVNHKSNSWGATFSKYGPLTGHTHNSATHPAASKYAPIHGFKERSIPLAGSAKYIRLEWDGVTKGYKASLQSLSLLFKQGKIL